MEPTATINRSRSKLSCLLCRSSSVVGLVFLSLQFVACGATELVREPDLTRHEKWDFLIDGIPISLWLPFNGIEGEYTRPELSTPTERRLDQLIAVGYDYPSSGSPGYAYTSLSFGVQKGKCCSEGLPAEAFTKNQVIHEEVETIEIEGQTVIYRVQEGQLGSITYTYYAPHNSGYSLYFRLSINEDSPNSESYRNARITMLKDLVFGALISRASN